MKTKLHLLLAIILLYACKSNEDIVVTTPTISSISLEGVSVLQTDISNTQKKITIRVPYQTDLTSIAPTIKTLNTVTIIPSELVAQNFTRAVYYTLISESGQKVIYEVSVITMEQPTPVITNVSKDTLEAGKQALVIGHYFGLNPTEVQASLVNASKETQLKTELIDSLHIQIYPLDDLLPGTYTLSLKIKNKTTNYNKPIVIEYPTPQIDSIDYWNAIQEEKIRVFGKYFSKNYTYQLMLVGKDEKKYSLATTSNDKIIECQIPSSVNQGEYSVKVINRTLKKESSPTILPLTIYRNDMPYLIDSEKITENSVKQGKTVTFSTLNFGKITSRFYQIQLENETVSIIQNALYNASNNRLSFEIPQIKGAYHVSLILSDESTILYRINTRFTLTIE
ncbi:IPT/TIG domain-containing protein [Flectobacillus longus]|uniref:IPT/TIG domain-containing protein n=1 Tax=Flectobacillus longus TaxID=2984207 RepID=UPI0024B84E31|nr:IPT/TIG domain-containing protein [Flectobacillus longus]MDI9881106.1 hypothetical protein [Flectobacillus longus]